MNASLSWSPFLDAAMSDDRPARCVRLLATLQSHGGCELGDAVTALLSSGNRQPISRVARWIVERDLLTLPGSDGRWVPMFQFDRTSMRPHSVVREAVAELAGVIDDIGLIEWFVTANHWLAGHLPAELLVSNPDSVHRAARFDALLSGV